MTVVDPPTMPSKIEGGHPERGPWQPKDLSGGQESPATKRVVASRGVTAPVSEPRPAANENGASTALRQQGQKQRALMVAEPVVIPTVDHGNRSLKVLMQWEGVVEKVEGDEFRARLTPYTDGVPDPSSVEFTEFSLDDLANAGDRELVQDGARFYWTIGRATNPAGTLTNVSLVRFRRLPQATSYRRRLAEAEADALLDYGSENRS